MSLGVRILQYEIQRRGIYINKLIKLIESNVKNCQICIMHKLNKFIKPDNIQITSKKLLERIEVDITYFGKKIELIDLKNKFLLILLIIPVN